MQPSAILFDLDDTILHSEGGDHLKIWQKSIAKHHKLLGDINPNKLFEEIRATAEEFWSDPHRHRLGRLDIQRSRQKIVITAMKKLGNSKEKDAIALADDYHNNREFNVIPFPNALETLKYFRKSSIKTALITNGGSDIQRSKIDKYQLDQYFDLILVEGEFGMGKPSREVYTHIVDQLEVTTERSWIVGDNLEWEVNTPQKLGFFTIWNDHLRQGLPINSPIVPDATVNSIYELINMTRNSETAAKFSVDSNID